MRLALAGVLCLLLFGCSSVPKTHTETPSLKYARNYVSDAKEGVKKARSTNDEIDIEIKKLLEIAE